jgi:hypothetical protein
MRTGRPLRLYSYPRGVLIHLLPFGAFAVAVTVVGALMVRDPGEVFPFVVGAWMYLVVAGLVIVLSWRLPVLQIDAHGWSSRLVLVKRTATWQEIRRVQVYRMGIEQGRKRRSTKRRSTRYVYNLFIYYKDAQKIPIVVPLSSLFLRPTPEKVEELLRRILRTYSLEIQLYGIQTSTEVQNLWIWHSCGGAQKWVGW